MEWVATLDDQPDDPVIRRRFLAWLGADPAHEPAFRAAEQAWAAALENHEVALPYRRRKRWQAPALAAMAVLVLVAAAVLLS